MNCNFNCRQDNLEDKNKVVKYVYCLGATGSTGPQGIQGEIGPTVPAGISDTISIGTVTTWEPGTPASVIDVSGGPNHVLDFVIPRGFNGNSEMIFAVFVWDKWEILLNK